ncbi:putative hydrolase [Porphyridium purpureum]|uniref:Putative hydrolase n=1 Tax=Porphyridium purpureum TaxID=35688 RepID=A0A5J4YQI2_PORPP|nr:putative hydrolase [Porphyridium purpureum]|eukprot:POR0763..scf296_7
MRPSKSPHPCRGGGRRCLARSAHTPGLKAQHFAMSAPPLWRRTVSEILILGSGTSEGVPRVSCLTASPPSCQTCLAAAQPDSKSRRRNTSIVVRKSVPGNPDERPRNVLFDCGKFFYEAAMTWFPKHSIRELDAVVLTHPHADHVLGMDDLRDFTLNVSDNPKPLPVFLDAPTMARVKQIFPYMVDREKAQSAVPNCAFIGIAQGAELAAPFEVAQGVLRITPLRVQHGRHMTALGFRFGDVSHIPDVSSVPDETLELMGGTRLLIVDALNPMGSNPTHFCLDDAVQLAERIRPERVVLVDATHRWPAHEDANDMLRERFSALDWTFELAHDGQRIDCAIYSI